MADDGRVLILVPVIRCPRAVDPVPGISFPAPDPRASVVGAAVCGSDGVVSYCDDVAALVECLHQRHGPTLDRVWTLLPDADQTCALLAASLKLRVAWPLDALRLARLLAPASRARVLANALEYVGIRGWSDTRSDGLGHPPLTEIAHLRSAACACARALSELWGRVLPVVGLESMSHELHAIALQTKIRLERPLLVDPDTVEQGLEALAKADVGAVDDPRRTHLLRLLKDMQRRAQTTGQLHSELDYLRTAPGRFAARGDLNVQTLPVAERLPKGPLRTAGEFLRRSLRVPDGCVLVAADASQIEPRITGWLTGQQEFHDIPAQGGDLYQHVADLLLAGVPSVLGGTVGRDLAKKCVLGLNYGMGARKLLEALQESAVLGPLVESGQLIQRDCEDLHGVYHGCFPRIRVAWEGLIAAAVTAIEGGPSSWDRIWFTCQKRGLTLQLPSGRCTRFAEVSVVPNRYGGKDIKVAGGCLHGPKLLQYVVTGIARDLLVKAMVTVENQGFPIYGHVHDDLICCVPTADADRASEALISAWSDVPAWASGLILDAKVKMGGSLFFEGIEHPLLPSVEQNLVAAPGGGILL